MHDYSPQTARPWTQAGRLSVGVHMSNAETHNFRRGIRRNVARGLSIGAGAYLIGLLVLAAYYALS